MIVNTVNGAKTEAGSQNSSASEPNTLMQSDDDSSTLDPSLSGSQEYVMGTPKGEEDPQLGNSGGASIADILRASGYGEDDYR